MADGNNVLLVVVDCLGSDALFGEGRSAQTPAMDGLRAAGVSFPNAVTAATYTTPSFVSLLTGLYPSAHGIRSLAGGRLDAGCCTLAGVLGEAGYDTAAFVTGPLGRETGLDRGFRLYEHRPPDDVCYGRWGSEMLASFPSQLRRPWFVLLHLWELHMPRYVGPAFSSAAHGRTPYERALSTVDAFISLLLERAPMGETLVLLTGDHGERVPGTAERFGLKLGKVLVNSVVKKLPVARTLYRKRVRRHVLNRDHGYHVRDALARVPLIIAPSPGGSLGEVNPAQVRTIDVLPTLLDMVGVPMPGRAGVQGRSLVPLIKTGEVEELAALTEANPDAVRPSGRRLIGLRTRRWKLCFAADDGDLPCELYHLERDPGEQSNVAGEFPEVARRLRQQALDLMAQGERLGMKPEALSAEEEALARQRLKDLGYL